MTLTWFPSSQFPMQGTGLVLCEIDHPAGSQHSYAQSVRWWVRKHPDRDEWWVHDCNISAVFPRNFGPFCSEDAAKQFAETTYQLND